MRYAALALLLLVPAAQASFAQEIPDWVKTSAAWWAEGAISEAEFVAGLEYLIEQGVLVVPYTEPAADGAGGVPDWVKTSAAWWAEGAISDGEFVSAIQYLIESGIIRITHGADPAMQQLQDELEACGQMTRAYDRLVCTDRVESEIEYRQYRSGADAYVVGPVTFYHTGYGSEGNDLFMEGEQPILTVRLMAENTGSDGNVALSCTGPAICSYDVWDGTETFKYSGMDFTNGQIVLKPGDARVFNMLFGPDIGYGGTQFKYDPAKEYFFRIAEPWGSAQIPVGVG